jgi:cell division protein ZapB
VNFTIAKNDVAPVSGKEILMRISDDNGNVLFDVARGSGTFELDGKETFYTAKQEILFDNTQQAISFLYNKGSEYLPGRYVMEIFTDGYLMGSKSFRVK